MKWLLKELLKLVENDVDFSIKDNGAGSYTITLIVFGDTILSKTITI